MKTIQLTPSVKSTNLTLSCSLDEGRITLNENLEIVTAESDTFISPPSSLSFHTSQGGQTAQEIAKRDATTTAINAIHAAMGNWRIAMYEADKIQEGGSV